MRYAGIRQRTEAAHDPGFRNLDRRSADRSGPDLPALFSNNEVLAQAWLDAGKQTRDPVWRMPLWRPYLHYLNSHVADLANAGSRMAGAVTAALYLERFVAQDLPWAHLDVYAWNDLNRPGRPAGGEALGLRSAWAMLKERYR